MAIQDDAKQFFLTELSRSQGDLPSLQLEWLASEGYTRGSIDERWSYYLRDNGQPPTGVSWDLLGLTRNKGGGGVSWSQWIEGLTATQVMDFDFSQTDRHFQDVNATLLADDATENIAFASDSASWGGASLLAFEAAQAEKIANGGFDSGASWSVAVEGGTATATISGGTFNATGDGTFAGVADQSFVTVAEQFFRIRGNTGGSGTLEYRIGTSVGGTQIANFNALSPGTDILAMLKATTALSHLRLRKRTTGTGTYDNISVKAIPGSHGLQGSASLQGKRQAGGVCRYDGTDDNHLTTFLAQNGAMTLLYHGTIDAVVSATQMFLGASGSAANRCWLAVTTAGFIAAGVGSESTSTIVGTTDVRGKTIVAALTFDGSTVKLFLRVDGAAVEEYSAAQASTPTTTIPFRIGAYNNNGTAAGFAKVDAKSIKAAHKAMSFAEFKSIAARLAA